MKFMIAAVSSFVPAPSAIAGTLVFEAEEEEEIIIVEKETMGSSNASWLIPLLAVGIIAVAIAASNDGDDGNGDDNGNGNGDVNGNGGLLPE